jgi:hypothetical protein
MAVFVVSYDLNAPGQNYQPLIDALEAVPHCHPLKSFWLVDVEQTAIEVRDALLSYMDSNDSLAVIEFTPTAQWAAYLPVQDIKWIESRPL